MLGKRWAAPDSALSLPKVPSTSNNPNVDERPRGILLVEEYGALAVAITAALEKFAPLHRVKTARNFAEAEQIAASIRPELFVIDLDPPPPYEINFFRSLSAQYPEARALIIAVGTSPELRAERGPGGALQFLEKPFDLAEFGAAVQALVGPRNGQSGPAPGRLRDLNLIDLVQLKCLALSSTLLRIKAGGREGVIHFRKGQISHVASPTKVGPAALEEIAGWPAGEISEAQLPVLAPQTVDISWPALLLPIVRQIAAREKQSAPLPAGRAPAASTAPSGKKILVIDDTEMLLVFVADVLGTAHPDYHISTAATGKEGLRLARTELPDLILLDYSLGDITGDKICAALLESEETASIPVLMMSGHPTELARTAEDYANVVAALPKPFLSGALISAVDKALALPPNPAAQVRKKSPTTASAGEITGASSVPPGEQRAASPNGHGPAGKTSPSAAEPLAPATATAPSPSPPRQPGAGESQVAPVLVKEAVLRVTLSFDVVALDLTSSLQTTSVRLEPISPFAAVEMADGIRFETSFRLGSIALARDGAMSSLRLIPTREPVPLPAAVNSFAIGRIGFDLEKHHLQLKAARERSMRVQLTAAFALAGIELSPRFEVTAIVVERSGNEVLLRNRGDHPGTAFELEQVELNPAGELRALVLRSLPND